jgi:hypothetical protein
MSHSDYCACRVCQWSRAGFTLDDAAALTATEEHTIQERVGWSVRAYLDGPWAETAGLRVRYGHPEFRMRLDVSPKDRQQWLNVFGRAVADGRTFTGASTVTDLFVVPVRLVAQDDALLCVFPDAAGRWPTDPGCALGYTDQLVADRPAFA